MKFKSALVTQASGSIFGMTASRNKGGNYFRQRQIPVNPNTPFQAAVRTLVAQLTDLWLNTLTQVQRDAWATYAANVPLMDTLGDPRNVPPLSMYVRSNVPRLQSGLLRIDAAPTVFNLGDFTAPSFTVDATTDEVDVAFTNTDAWATATLNAMLIYGSRPQSASINFFKGPYRFLGRINGAVIPPTSPATIALAFPVVVGQRVFFKASVTRSDGRLSTPFRGFGTAA